MDIIKSTTNFQNPCYFCAKWKCDCFALFKLNFQSQ